MILASNKQHKEKLGGGNKIDTHKRKTKHREPAHREKIDQTNQQQWWRV
jgi:hypothetical protein